ncbi:MAG: hypothetical protein H6708_13850 [Kofleriaceae bacterium]|nr:hypothetical protein [Myxococcales bacterium]MCB9561485.1 hypothetical protein [Kofleriaceae bacterium]
MPVPGGRAALAAAAFVVCAPSAVAASPLELFGFGARSTGLAGAGVASTDSYESVYLNPAGLAHVPRKRATIGTLYGDFSLRMDGDDTGTESARGLVIGGELPIPFGGAWKDRVGLGFGFYVPAVAINRARHPFPGEPVFVLLENRTHVIAIQLAAGARITSRLDVGVGVVALAVLQGSIAVSTDAAGRFTTASEQQLLTRLAPVAGVRWHARDDLDLGAVARAPSRSDYDILVTSDIGDVVPIELPPIHIAGAAQYDPGTVAIEAAWQTSPGLTLSAQLQWQHWGAFPLPTKNPTEGTPAQELPDFHDTVVPRLAIERVGRRGATTLAARGGLAFVMSPAPEQSGRQSLLDNHRVIGAAGVGVAWPEARVPLHLDAWVQWHQLVPRTHTKDVGAFGPDDMIPFDVLETSGHLVVGGLSVGVDL